PGLFSFFFFFFCCCCARDQNHCLIYAKQVIYHETKLKPWYLSRTSGQAVVAHSFNPSTREAEVIHQVPERWLTVCHLYHTVTLKCHRRHCHCHSEDAAESSSWILFLPQGAAPSRIPWGSCPIKN
ncbi:hypothetical protein LEMLEM_LOCUS24086, partial [Lemmus lemmus]